MESLSWDIVALGTSVGGLMMILGLWQPDKKPLIMCVVRRDWTPTGNIDFRGTTPESSCPQPLRLLVEEERIKETAFGRPASELRWRLATIKEGKKLVMWWNARQSSPTALLPRPCLVE
jgi:hypothetical protein